MAVEFLVDFFAEWVYNMNNNHTNHSDSRLSNNRTGAGVYEQEHDGGKIS